MKGHGVSHESSKMSMSERIAEERVRDLPSAAKVDQKQIDYTSYSVNYDEHRFEGAKNEYLESLRLRAVLKLLGPGERHRSVIDVGCGTGRGLLAIGLAGFDNLTGIDYTPAMLEQARTKLDEQLPDRSISLVQGDAFSLPFPENSFDTVISLNFLHMFRLDRQCELVKEMHRICRPGGRVVVEFESIHKGLFFTRYWEQRRLVKRTKFNSFWEIRRIFSRDDFEDVHVLGTELPLAYRLFHRVPRVGRLIESIIHYPPFTWLGARVVVGGRKRQVSGP